MRRSPPHALSYSGMVYGPLNKHEHQDAQHEMSKLMRHEGRVRGSGMEFRERKITKQWWAIIDT